MTANIMKSQLRSLYGEGNGLSSSKVYLHVQDFKDGFLMHNSHTDGLILEYVYHTLA